MKVRRISQFQGQISFPSFDELYEEYLFGFMQSLKILGADAIYATNANRKLLTTKGIQTDFKIKGRPGRHHEHKSQLSKMITKERVSKLEGSFGTDKEFFLLKKIRARNEKTERLWIFFGIHTSNAFNIGKRISQKANTQHEIAMPLPLNIPT